ncbi:ROK family protein [Streptomyces mangrovisoli]|uniref:Transcriptional regulator n=1 Tax=Streptomyces mangrovisoli TaxID=1428628 RepID=A0A1J4NVT3_9ACTN|nr:ROK family protein [Streptomyces mangrovisoli]OIJ65333.1 hypothetical protein WN71_023945 [Streptomyces mangrovisoli]
MTAHRGQRSSAALLESAILDCFDGVTALHRAEIVQRTGLSRTVVASLLSVLTARGVLLMTHVERTGTPGRPAFAYQLRSAVGPVLLIRVSGSALGLSLVGPGGVRDTAAVAVPSVADSGWVDGVREFMAKAEAAQARTRHVVISAPFPVNQAGEPAYPSSPALGGSYDVLRQAVEGVRRRLVDALDRPVLMVNDAQLAALGEASFGAAVDARASVHLSVRHGIGCGLVLGGQPFTGPDGTAGEIAHVRITDTGPDCFCGGTGCLATQFGTKDIDLALAGLYGRPLTPAEADALVAANDPRAVGYYREVALKVARALAGIVTVLTPDVIVLDAELGPAHVPFASSLADGLARYCPPLQVQGLRLLRGRLRDAQAAGAMAYRPTGEQRLPAGRP